MKRSEINRVRYLSLVCAFPFPLSRPDSGTDRHIERAIFTSFRSVWHDMTLSLHFTVSIKMNVLSICLLTQSKRCIIYHITSLGQYIFSFIHPLIRNHQTSIFKCIDERILLERGEARMIRSGQEMAWYSMTLRDAVEQPSYLVLF